MNSLKSTLGSAVDQVGMVWVDVEVDQEVHSKRIGSGWDRDDRSKNVQFIGDILKVHFNFFYRKLRNFIKTNMRKIYTSHKVRILKFLAFDWLIQIVVVNLQCLSEHDLDMGIYTSKNNWEEIAGKDCNQFSYLPLWFPRYPGKGKEATPVYQINFSP